MDWQIPKMWEDGECWILGGGPSLSHQFNIPEDTIQRVLNREESPSVYSPYLSALHTKHVIAVNAAYLLGDWMDIIFFGDANFYRTNRKQLLFYPKLKVTCNSKLKQYTKAGEIKCVARDNNKPHGLTIRKGHVSWNGNSGAAAINLAVQLGAKKIILLGFDMECTEGMQHWHSHYKPKGQPNMKELRKLPFHRHIKCFEHVAKDAKRLGVEILNVSPHSQIKEIKKVQIQDVL